MNQPGKGANPSRGQLNRENEYSPGPVRGAPVNTPAQFCERSTAAKERFQRLIYKPIILNSEPHASSTLNCSASLWRSSVTNVFRCGVLAAW